MTTPTPPHEPQAPDDVPDDSDAVPAALWMTRNDAVEHLKSMGIKATRHSLTKMAEAGEIPSRRVAGAYGEQLDVEISSLVDHPGAQIRTLRMTGPVDDTPSTDMVLHQTVERLLDQVSVLHGAGERVGRAETKLEMREEQLADAKGKIRELESQLAEAIAHIAPTPNEAADASPSTPEPESPTGEEPERVSYWRLLWPF